MKKKNIDLQKVQDQYFKLYPKAKVLYFTSDGNCFLEKSPALDHSVKAKVELSEVPNPNMKAAATSPSGDEKKAAALEALKSWKEDNADYHQSYDLATDLGLELENKKKETVIAALKEAQAKLNENK